MSNWNNSFDLGNLTWLLSGIPWIFVAKKAFQTYGKYGAKKFSKIILELISMGAAATMLGLMGMAIAGLIKSVFTGEIHDILTHDNFAPEVIFIGGMIMIGIYIIMSVYVFHKAYRHYKKLTHCNPLGI